MAGLTFGTSTSITITAGSLGSGSNRSSAAVTVTAGSLNIAQILLTINILTTSTAPSGNKQVMVYGYKSEDGSVYQGNSGTTDNVDGTDKALTAIGSPTALTMLGTIPLNQGAVAVTARFVTDIVNRFGTIPKKWGFVLYNDAGTALGATITATYTEVYYA